MKILQIIHGYPMRYNAGSEVYTQTLCHALAERQAVEVFTREEDAFAPDAELRHEPDLDDRRVRLHLVNNPRMRDRYRDDAIDRRFAEVLERFTPNVVHVQHLNHLSTSLLREAARREIPIVYTLHDYWLMCPRGQFMQMHPEDPRDLWAACDGQEDRKCAERCYARYFSGAESERAQDVAYWTSWVARRMAHVRAMSELVDVFIAPSQYLLERYRDDFGLPSSKFTFLDYGFDRARLAGRRRTPGEPTTFGYIGTHIPAKGIDYLIRAFGRVRGDARLRIWGRPRGQDTAALRALANTTIANAHERVEWLPEYRNQAIVRDVLDRVDAIVVPSVWAENSPLVIHEALQARVPVVTADIGGMREYVHHDVNGLLFSRRDVDSLAAQMQRLVDAPSLGVELGARGYVQSPTGDVPSIEDHVSAIERLYEHAIRRRDRAYVTPLPGPWRITFDTNPDDCNLRCIMCEEHSPHSDRQDVRVREGRPRRRMPLDLIRRVLEDARSSGLREIIPSTMGEPLLFDGFDDILAMCREFDVRLNLTTNGTFPRHGARVWAERIVPVASDVKISWNGATRKTHESIMVGSRWDVVLANLRTFIEVRDAHARDGGNRCRVTLQLTFLETNVGELADVVRLAAGLGVDRVKGHHLWAHFDAIAGLSMRRSPDSIRRWNAAVVAARATSIEHRKPDGTQVLLENIFELDEGAIDDIAPDGRCPFLGQEAWVSAEGRFDPCCAPDEQRRTLGDLGRLTEMSIRDIWSSAAYRELLGSYRNRALCMGCNMRKPASGS